MFATSSGGTDISTPLIFSRADLQRIAQESVVKMQEEKRIEEETELRTELDACVEMPRCGC